MNYSMHIPWFMEHNIFHTHNSNLWDRQYFMEHSSIFGPNVTIFYGILSVPYKNVMILNNVMNFVLKLIVAMSGYHRLNIA